MSREHLIVIGGDAAGMSGASQARKLDSSLKISVFEMGEHVSYAAWGLPYYIGSLVDDPKRLIARTPEAFKEKSDIDVYLKHEVVQIDPEAQTIKVRDLSKGEERVESFDKLLIATGSSPVQPFPEADGAENVFTISSLTSGIAIKQYLENHPVTKAVVVGAGYISLEMAEALSFRGIQVTMIQRGPEVMSTFDPSMGKRVGAYMQDDGITVLTNSPVHGFDIQEGKAVAIRTEQQAIAADIFLMGMGVKPNSGIAGQAGLALGPAQSIRVDESGRTSNENIWAAGDCCQVMHLVSGQPVYIPLGTTANKQGRTAGITIGGGQATLQGVLGTAITKYKEIECARTGLGTRQLKDMGIDFVSAEIDAKTLPGYYPGSASLAVKLFAERGSGRLLGGQIVGGPGAAKRIDTLAMALHMGCTLENMLNVDLSYAPPFSNVWDPLVIAARIALKKM